MPWPSVSLIIVNYRTPKQIKLCLRSLRRFTILPCQTIVVDNGSGDASSDYLRSLPWIELLENPHQTPLHANALDHAVRHATGEVVVVLHSDTFVRREGWLEQLVGWMEPETMILGSPDRLVLPFRGIHRLQLWRKRRKMLRRWSRKGRPPKIISHCVLYRRELFTEHGQRFDHPQYVEGEYSDCGEPIQRYCEANGLGIKLLRCEDLSPLLWHFEAATLNLVTGRRVAPKRLRFAERFYRRPEIREILEDERLDR
jgi:glycosyltransferase involved in cell wall biosynthesis